MIFRIVLVLFSFITSVCMCVSEQLRLVPRLADHRSEQVVLRGRKIPGTRAESPELDRVFFQRGSLCAERGRPRVHFKGG